MYKMQLLMCSLTAFEQICMQIDRLFSSKNNPDGVPWFETYCDRFIHNAVNRKAFKDAFAAWHIFYEFWTHIDDQGDLRAQAVVLQELIVKFLDFFKVAMGVDRVKMYAH